MFQPIQARVIVNNPLGNDHGGERPHLLGHYNGDIRTTSGHSKDSPVHSNRNSAASTDSGRGISTVQLDATGPNKVGLLLVIIILKPLYPVNFVVGNLRGCTVVGKLSW